MRVAIHIKSLATILLLASCGLNSFADPAVLPEGLVGWWRGEGNALDSAGTNDGIINGSVTFLSGIVGEGFELGGATGFIKVPDAPSLNPTDAITVAAWYLPISFGGAGENAIVDKGYSFSSNQSNPGIQYHLGVQGDQYGNSGLGAFDFQVKADGVLQEASTPLHAWIPGNWYYLAGTYDGAWVKLYVNGALVDSQPLTGSMRDYEKDLFIGLYLNDNYLTPGTIDEVAIFDRALTSNEIAEAFLVGGVGNFIPPWPPAITANPPDQHVALGGSALLSVLAIGVPPLNYQWQFNGSNLIDTARITGATSNFLTISGIGTNDVGSYQAVVTDLFGSSTSSLSALDISIGILASPTNQIVDVSATATFQVSAIGIPPLTYQWMRSGTNLTDDARIQGSQSPALNIGDVLSSDVADYQVKVTNAYGSATSAAATLKVNYAPIILVQPQNQIVPPGANDTLAVLVTSLPASSYQWRFNGTNLADKARISGSQTNILTFANLLPGDAGNYDVIVSNPYGSLTSSVATLKFSNPVSPPLNIAPTVIWAAEGGGPNGTYPNGTEASYDGISGIASDGRGGFYMTAGMGAYARFGNLELTNLDSAPTSLLVKYDAVGRPVWGKQGYGNGITGLVGTADGGVLVVGLSSAPAMIDGQFIDVDQNPPFDAICPGCSGGFTYVIKYNAEGNRLWFHAIYHESSLGGSPLLVMDSFGNVSVLVPSTSNHLSFNAAVDFEGEIVRGTEGQGEFLFKFDPAGNFQSAKQIIAWNPIPEYDYSVDLDDSQMDAEGNLYITGRFWARGGVGLYTDTLNIGSASLGQTDPNDAGADVWFAAKLDANGDGLWVKGIGSGGHPTWRIKVDDAANVYLAGMDGDTIAKLIKLDPYGHLLWTKSGVTLGAMTCDGAGNVLMAGPYYKSDFEHLIGHSVDDSLFNTGAGMGLVGFSPSGQIRFTRYYSEPAGIYSGSIYPAVLVQDSVNSWIMAGTFSVSGQMDGFKLQTPWPGRDDEDFIACLAIPAMNDLPLITVPPQDVTVFETRPLRLEVAAASLPPTLYQWKFNGLPISGANASIIYFTNASLDLNGSYSVAVTNQNGGVESAPATVAVLPVAKLGEALNATNLQWSLGGSRSWQLETNVTHDGQLSLRTDYLLMAPRPVEDCWIETSVEGPGSLSFWWKASTRPHNPFCGCDDGFQFLVDGVQQFEIVGDVDWEPRSLPIPEGPHTVLWYWSEWSIGNLNLCWLDQVSFLGQQAGAPLITSVTALANGAFQFAIKSNAGAILGIEACSDLKNWLPIGQLATTDGMAVFTHSASTNYQRHFYRAVQINP